MECSCDSWLAVIRCDVALKNSAKLICWFGLVAIFSGSREGGNQKYIHQDC